MQHAIGYVLMGQMRECAAATIPQDASPEARQLALRVLDRAVFGLMEICDGYNAPLHNSTHEFSVDVVGTLRRRDNQTVMATQALGGGAGACMGVHMWLDGDFGDLPPVVEPQAFTPQSDWLAR